MSPTRQEVEDYLAALTRDELWALFLSARGLSRPAHTHNRREHQSGGAQQPNTKEA